MEAKELTNIEQIAMQISQLLTKGLSQIPEFADSPVPMKVATKVLGMDAEQIRNRMETGELDIGYIFPAQKKRGVRAYRNTYISPKKFWEVTGYIWRGEKNE